MVTKTNCTCVAVRRASQAITHFYDSVLEPSGLKVTQLSLLRAVRRLETAKISSLAETLQLDRTTLGRNLTVLERDGLVSITPGDDSRMRIVTLTEQGCEALDRAAPLWDAAQARLVEQLGSDRLQTLREMLSDIEALAS
ncbi:MAG TPA: MarR family winged helix-turn-helix transcriptional regulator [Herpetosiphonaceae bacterium]